MYRLLAIMILQIDGAAVVTELLKSSPVMAVAGMFGWYMYRDNQRKDGLLVESEEKREKLNDKLIAEIEKRVASEQKQIGMLHSIVEKTGNIPAIIKEEVKRLEQNQSEIKAEIKSLKP